MYMRNMFLLFSLALLAFAGLLSACADGPASSPAPGLATPRSTGVPLSPVSTITLPDEGVAATIPVGPTADITVESGSAKQLTFIGADTRSISSNSYALPYRKKGNAITISFGQVLAEALEITLPARSHLTVTLTTGNVSVENFQSQVTVALTSGTIQLKKFAPHGISTITVQSGTIDVTFVKQAACRLNARTDFGAIISGYPAIPEKRSGMQAQAAGVIGNDADSGVDLTTNSGSISFEPA